MQRGLLSFLTLLPWGFVGGQVLSDQAMRPSSGTMLHLLGLACFEGPLRNLDVMQPAVSMGLEDVKRFGVLPGYDLKVIWRNTWCLPGEGVNSMYEELYRQPTKMMILGPGLSVVSKATAQSSHLWNLLQISPISETPALSDKKVYPLFFRTTSPYSVIIATQLALLKHFGWQRIATIHQSIELYSEAMNRLVLQLKDNNITLISSEIFVDDPRPQIDHLQEYDARIILAGFSEHLAPFVFCEAYKAGLYGRKHVWIMPGYFPDTWWQTYPSSECSNEQLAEAYQGTLGISAMPYDIRDIKGINGLTAAQWLESFKTYVDHTEPVTGFLSAGRSYDMAWTAALILNYTAQALQAQGSTRRLEDFNYLDVNMTNLMVEGARKVAFQGVKGWNQFDDDGDNTALIEVVQFQDGVKQLVGLHDFGKSDLIDWSGNNSILWQGAGPPRDSTIRLTELVSVQIATYIGICSTATLGMLMSLVFLIFNIMYRHKRFIKMSSPVMNNITIFGSVLAYLTVFLQETSNTNVLLLCRLRSYSLMLGFSMAFGALFAKTWRVYMIFTRTTKRTVLRDHQLIMIVVILAGIDVVLATLREILDPLFVSKVVIGNIELNGGDTIITKEIRLCTSNYETYFKGAIFAIKGLLLIFGAFLSFQTRKVNIPALNDSQYIGMCIYNIAVLSILGVVISFVLTDQVNLSYMCIGGFIIFGTTITQVIIFVPKILKFMFANTDDEEVNTQLGTVNGAGQMPTMLPNKIPVAIQENKSKEIEDAKKMVDKLKAELEKLKKA